MILKQYINADGYANVYLSWAGKGKKVTTYKVHRLVAQAFIPNPLLLPYINHIDENKTNNNKDNLEWCTGHYNATYGSRLHCVCGSNNKGSKLNEQIVEEIRKTYKKNDRKHGQRALARKYGVGHNAIGCIVRGKNWLHDPKEYLSKQGEIT